MPLKLFGRETERLARWQNLKMAVQNRDIETSKMGILFKLSNTFIAGVQGLAVFYVGAGQVMDGHLTVGMLMAFSHKNNVDRQNDMVEPEAGSI